MLRARVLTVLLGGALALAGCGGDDTSSGSGGESAATATPAPAPACTTVAAPKPRGEGKLAKPKQVLTAGKTYVATVSTNCGDFEIALDAKRAPVTGGNFKYLADQKFFDGLSFHRIVKDFVIQGGDPAGDGSGGPGYTIVEAPPKQLTYDKGVVAMAKTGTDPPGASGSQFFVVTGPGAATLPAEYALLGKVTGGMDIVEKINGIQADPDTGQPASPVAIKSIRVKAS
jgi:peptidyl-prolyl cis-trans isomerase B (cyclophilin B)